MCGGAGGRGGDSQKMLRFALTYFNIKKNSYQNHFASQFQFEAKCWASVGLLCDLSGLLISADRNLALWLGSEADLDL